jgi:hypothetical protein
MRLTSSLPGELIRLPSSGSIPELPHVAKLSLRRAMTREQGPASRNSIPVAQRRDEDPLGTEYF